MIAPKRYPEIIPVKRFARNGMLPDVRFLNRLIKGANHVAAYRRKMFLTYSDMIGRGTSSSAVEVLRFRGHTGYGCTGVKFVLGLGLDTSGVATNPHVDVSVTEVGTGTTTETIYHGLGTAGSDDFPSSIAWRDLTIPANENTTIEVAIETNDYARVVAATAFEVANDEVEIDTQAVIGLPIEDRLRKELLEGLSLKWQKNGSHLVTFIGRGNGTANNFTSTTWTNVVDLATSVSANTAGFYLDGLASHCRLIDGAEMDVVLAVHGSCASGSNGEVRLEHGTLGTLASITGITTSSQWHTTTTTIASVDEIDKVDIQARVGSADTFTLNAVCLYTLL